ncbi:BREX-3 system phosphatase PglZ [Bacillus sp. S13(2024)]|uniref:BREX-3 system phosphatase PglZ n=1 Tax=unclassified Bacillus (in: firmicutes) TaxID=185979 RepID=UPI003D23CE17
MSGWRDEVLRKFQYQNNKLLLVHDKDFLLSDELILSQLTDYDYEVVRFEDSISFRYLYEQQYRLHEKECKVIVYTNDDIVFPYEFIRKGFSISINISTIFPKFSASILRSMNREDLDALFTAHAQYQGSSSNAETLAYIVKHVYKIPYEIIDSEVELYKLLLSIHYKKADIPQSIQKFLIGKLQLVEVFRKFPIENLISSAAFFYHFLEEQWDSLVTTYKSSSDIQIFDPFKEYETHPFANHDVRRLMNDLFMEGILLKAKGISALQVPKWMKAGIAEETEDIAEKLCYLSEKVKEQLISAKQYKDWIHVMDLISEYKYTYLDINGSGCMEDVDKLMDQVNTKFESWMVTQYHTLTSLPPFPKPKMVHHVPHTLQANRKGNEKIALLVLDGMSFVQWKQVRDYLRKHRFSFEENGIFAWVPTLTSVSRQAIFSGNMPLTFSNTLKTTAAEEKLWKAFWENQGVLKQYVAYQKGLGTEKYDRGNIRGLSKHSVKVYGAVIDVIDQLTHSTILGEKSMASNLKIWMETNYLAHLLTDLLNDGYSVYLTSDHGNTKATGIGRISEGVLVDQKGERVRIYSDKTLYNHALSKIDGLSWGNAGLPDSYYVLLSQYKQAFVPKEQEIITHGGISIEEVIVPFVKVQQK